jgi:hypothetical protein
MILRRDATLNAVIERLDRVRALEDKIEDSPVR